MDTNEPNLLTIRVNLNNDKKQKKKKVSSTNMNLKVIWRKRKRAENYVK